MFFPERKEKKPSRCIFPGYKWCGPGCSGPGAPVNGVDACCMRHDRCLAQGGSRCRCDQEFIDCLQPEISRGGDSGKTAALISDVMKFRAFFSCTRF